MAERKIFDWSVLRDEGVDEPAADDRSPATDDRSPTTEDRLRTTDDRLPFTGFPLRVNDLKQYAYCPRIIFYQYAMPVRRKSTFKMEHGKQVEAKIEQLEKRRRLREYGLAQGTRRFQVWLSSMRLGLAGRLDLMITTSEAIFPVDFKDTMSRVHRNHHVQLCAYALLIEDTFGKPVPAGFIYRVPRDDVAVVEMTGELRGVTRRCIEEIREMIAAEHMPGPTPVRARCTDCEYRNYCGDIF